MSDQLYLNKAKRLEAQADAIIEKIINDITDQIHELSAGSVDKDDNLRKRITAPLNTWQMRSKPDHAHGENGKFMLMIPAGASQHIKGKKRGTVYKSSRVRAFIVDENRALDVYRISFGKNSGGDSVEDARELLHGIVNGKQPKSRNKMGQKLNNYSADVLAKDFAIKNDRYTGSNSPFSYIAKQIARIAQEHRIKGYSLNEEIKNDIQRVEEIWMTMAENLLLASIDRDAYRAINKNRHPDLHDYNWLTQNTDTKSRDFRLGAFVTYPGLMRLFTETPAIGESVNRQKRRSHDYQGSVANRNRDRAALTRYIDEGKSVPAALKEVFAEEASAGIPKKYLAPYHGVNDEAFDHHGRQILTKTIDVLPAFKREDYPSTPQAWQIFNQSVDNLRGIMRDSSLNAQNLISHYGKNIPSAPDKKQTWRDIRDFSQKLNTTLLLPIMSQRIEAIGNIEEPSRLVRALSNNTRIKDKLNGLFTIPQIIRGSKEWHERIQTVNTQLKSIAVQSDIAWPALVDEMKAPNGVTFTPLTTKMELEDEGSYMSHCVGGYSYNCISGRSHILHLTHETAEGEKHESTLQLVEETGANGKITLSINQNRGFSNKPPHGENKKAADWLVTNINSGKIEIDWAAIDKGRKATAEKYEQNALINQIGFDPNDPENCEKAYEIMGRFLPTKYQAWSYQDFLEQSGFCALIAEETDKHLEKLQTKQTPQPL